MKTCLKCLVEKPIGDFGRALSNPDKKNHYCERCRATFPMSVLLVLGVKTCSKCHEVKPRSEFRLYKQGNAQRSHCAGCDAGYQRELYHRDSEKAARLAREYAKPYRERNRDRLNIRARNYRATHLFGGKTWSNHILQYKQKRAYTDSDYRLGLIESQKARVKKYHHGIIDRISDVYVRRVLGLSAKIPHIQEIIETKRAIIQLNRERKKLNTLNIS